VSRPSRLKNFDYRGRYSYFLTFCTADRQQVLGDPATASMVTAHILQTARWYDFVVLAYCIMPDHLHLLIHGQSDRADARRFASSLKRRTGQGYASSANTPLWQEGYYDHVVRPEENFDGIARYIFENPVRAGIVTSAVDYPFIGSESWPIADLLR
jgi:putative transposase